MSRCASVVVIIVFVIVRRVVPVDDIHFGSHFICRIYRQVGLCGTCNDDIYVT